MPHEERSLQGRTDSIKQNRIIERKNGMNGLAEPVEERRQTLPEYLRQLRISRHYRQNFVASKLNISRQTYSHYETGRIRPPAGALYSLARLYEIPVENLLSRMMLGQYGIENHMDKNEKDDRMEVQLLSCFRSLGERDKEDILSIINLRIKNKGEEENQDAECKATV